MLVPKCKNQTCRLISIIAICLPILFIACERDVGDSEYKKAYELYQDKDYDLAISLFEKALEKNPTDPNYRLRFGNALEDDDQVERAIEQYEIIIKNNSTHVLAMVSLANAYRKVKKTDLAVQTMRRAISLKKREPWMLDNFGNILEEAGNFQEAYNNYKLAVEYEPYDPEFRMDLANIAVKMDKKFEAIKLFKQLKAEASDQYNILSHEEEVTVDEVEKQKLQIEKGPYRKSYDYCVEMLNKLEQ